MVEFDRSRSMLERHAADMRQFAGARPAVLENGVRIIDVHNSSGLTFSLLPDRGLDIWAAHFKGTPLTWLGAGAPHPPDHGSSWLRQFNGGLLVTCGLQHAGPSETDPETSEVRGIHGHYTRLPADVVRREGRWEGDAYIVEVTGHVAQSRLFGEMLRLTRTIRVVLGEPALEIRDEVVNRGDRQAAFMLLYHFNLGYPLVRGGSRIDVTGARCVPRDAEARRGADAWSVYGPAEAEYAEQVFYHHVTEEDGRAIAMVSNGDLGLHLTWDTARAPYFTQWKNLRQGFYVSGLEPGNCLPEGQNAARQAGRLCRLDPGETHAFRSRLEVIEGGEAVQSARTAIDAAARRGRPVVGCALDDRDSDMVGRTAAQRADVENLRG